MSRQNFEEHFPESRFSGPIGMSDLRQVLLKMNNDSYFDGINSLNNLNDVDISDIEIGYMLKWNGDVWESVDASLNPPEGLELVTIDGKTGWRLINVDSRYRDMGQNAIDFCAFGGDAWNNVGPSGQQSITFNGAVAAKGRCSIAAGTAAIAEGDNSFAFGTGDDNYGTSPQYCTVAQGYGSFSFGAYSTAEADNSVIFGSNCKTKGEFSVTLGYANKTEGDYSIALNRSNNAIGEKSFASGFNTSAEGESSHSEGIGTKAINPASHVEGRYNVGLSSDTIHETGIGIDNNNRKNAFEIYTDGVLVAPEAVPYDITHRSQKAIPTIEWLLSSEFGQSLPTSDPGEQGRLWNDSGVLKISQ